MHDLIREMGQNIIQKYHPHHRLLLENRITEQLIGKPQCEEAEGMVVWRSALPQEENVICMNEALKSMKRLRLLWLPSKESYSVGLEYLSNELQWLDWEGYHLDSLPARFVGRKLVALIMRHSVVIEPMTREQRFEKLRIMDLSWSYKVKAMFGGFSPEQLL